MKEIPGFPNYSITKDGRVWNNKHKRWLAGHIDDRGRPRITLCMNGKQKMKRIHQLILLAYIGPCPEGMEACHKDGNQQNNHLNNLYYGTHSENMFDSVQHGTHYSAGKVGEEACHSKLSNYDRQMIIYMYSTGLFTQKQIADVYDITASQVSRIVLGKIYPYCKAVRKAYHNAGKNSPKCASACS